MLGQDYIEARGTTNGSLGLIKGSQAPVHSDLGECSGSKQVGSPYWWWQGSQEWAKLEVMKHIQYIAMHAA
ncbi:hypothetical protein BC828DRAFT_409573 [Blastocladiella britannica]|nr:hypothetical protein BC828DRAFT_409573 [Blastocladiella britannica]